MFPTSITLSSLSLPCSPGKYWSSLARSRGSPDTREAREVVLLVEVWRREVVRRRRSGGGMWSGGGEVWRSEVRLDYRKSGGDLGDCGQGR